MKKLFFLFALVSLVNTFTFAQNLESNTPDDTVKETAAGPKMVFESTEVDYGTIEQNSDPLRKFNFTNDGNEPLIIKHAKGSCGCTVPSYPKAPIMPGESAAIEVRYDTKRIGKFTKTVTLTTNESGEQKTVLRIKGNVLKKPEQPAAVPANSPNILNGGN